METLISTEALLKEVEFAINNGYQFILLSTGTMPKSVQLKYLEDIANAGFKNFSKKIFTEMDYDNNTVRTKVDLDYCIEEPTCFYLLYDTFWGGCLISPKNFWDNLSEEEVLLKVKETLLKIEASNLKNEYEADGARKRMEHYIKNLKIIKLTI